MRNRILLPIFIVAMSLFLTQLFGCAHLLSTSTFHYISPNSRYQQLQAIKNWKVAGALSIQSPEQSIIAHYQWKQIDQYYDIDLNSTLNLVRVNITGQKNQYVRLCRSKSQCYQAKTPEILLKQQLNWNLPVSSLTYWVRGLQQPNRVSKKQYDEFGHLIFMRQNGFDIWFSNYKTIDGIDLPLRLDLQYSNLKIRLIIKQWNI